MQEENEIKELEKQKKQSNEKLDSKIKETNDLNEKLNGSHSQLESEYKKEEKRVKELNDYIQ